MSAEMNRRKFLKMLAAGTCGAACHNLMLPANGMMAYAATPSGRVKYLVNLFLYGGCDAYGLTPIHNAGAQQKMGSLYRTPAQAAALPGSPDLSLHAAFAPLIAEANQGAPHIAVITGAGSLAPNLQFSRSHDEAQDGGQDILRRYDTSNGKGIGAVIAEQIAHPFGLVTFEGASLYTTGGAYPARSIASLENGGLPGFWQDDWFRLAQMSAEASAGPTNTSEQQHIRESIVGMRENIATLANLGSIQPPVTFPGSGIGQQLKDVTRLIQSRIGAHVFSISRGGFDTHSNQLTQHNNIFAEMNTALVAFVRALKQIPGINAASAWDETVLITSTDFGRTFTNGAAGTDHGFCSSQLMIGGAVKGGVYGDVPNAAKFQNETANYAGRSWMQFNTGQAYKEAVAQMGLSTAAFPDYPGNIYSPIGLFI